GRASPGSSCGRCARGESRRADVARSLLRSTNIPHVSGASRIPVSSLRLALEEGLPLRGRSESSACRFQVAKLVPYVAIAPHGGARVRRDVARLLRTHDAVRRRIADVATDRLVSAAPVYVAALDSRIDYDLELPEESSP